MTRSLKIVNSWVVKEFGLPALEKLFERTPVRGLYFSFITSISICCNSLSTFKSVSAAFYVGRPTDLDLFLNELSAGLLAAYYNVLKGCSSGISIVFVGDEGLEFDYGL